MILMAWLLPALSGAWAAPLYPDLVERAEVTAKQLDEARKQIREHKAVEVLDELSLPPFHHREVKVQVGRPPLCMLCHLSLPHRENERTRTFLNMHSRYLSCETCHLQPKGVKLEYRWLADDGSAPGQPVADAVSVAEDEQIPSIIPQPGARIAPFSHGEVALIFQEHPLAKEVKRVWQEGSPEEKSRLKARLHTPLEKKGPECKACHGEESPLLDLEALGASPQQLRAIRQNTIVRFFNRFEEDDERLRIDELLR